MAAFSDCDGIAPADAVQELLNADARAVLSDKHRLGASEEHADVLRLQVSEVAAQASLMVRVACLFMTD
jgi:hypothetical protein